MVDPKNPNIVYAYLRGKILRSSDRCATFPKTISVPAHFLGNEGRMAIHPADSKIIYLSGSFYADDGFCPAVAKSGDGGKTWTVTKFKPTAYNGWAFGIAIHPKNPNVIYICTEIVNRAFTLFTVAIFVSTNGGETYKDITNDIVFNSCPTSHVYALALHPTDPNVLYVAHSRGVVRTKNGGVSWQSQASSSGLEVSALALDAANPSTLYGLGASNEAGARGCWKSVDGGEIWTNYGSGIYGCGERILVNGDTIIGGTGSGIYKSHDAGVHWKPSHSGIRASPADSFAVAPSSPSTIYACVDEYGLFKTTNGGGAWTKCPDFYRSGDLRGCLVHPSDPKKVFFRTPSCVYRSTDGAKTKKSILQKPITGGGFGDPGNPNRIAVAGFDVYDSHTDPNYIGLYLSSNSGDSWRMIKIAKYKGNRIYAAAFAPSKANIIYAGGHTGGYSQGVIYQTANSGASWTRLSWASPYIISIAVDPEDPNIVYAGTLGQGTYRSADGGQTWVKCTAGAYGSGAFSIIINKGNSNEVILGGRGGVFLSVDRGLTWTDISEGLIDNYIYHLEFHAASRTLFAGTNAAGIWKKKL